MGEKRGQLSEWLKTAPPAVFSLYAMFAGFATYFCMYAYRKPFAAAKFEGLKLLGTHVNLKTAFIISQILGYTLSKYIGIKVVSEVTSNRRAAMLVTMIIIAELSLLAFAVLPEDLKVLAIFCNGLPLGMVFGLVVWYLEGRCSSDLLLTGLSCSLIVASGSVKAAGLYLMSWFALTEWWMPFVTGLVFLPFLLASTWLLNQLPAPNADDVAARTMRAPMDGTQRLRFIRQFFTGLVLLIAVYLFLTAYRDFRDNYQVELYAEFGYTNKDMIFWSELGVAIPVMLAMATLNLVRDNRLGLVGAYIIMVAGPILMGGGTLLLDLGIISGFWWIVLMGIGVFLAYIPYNTILFDKVIATTRFGGTAVFAIYVADAIGYTGSIGVQLYKDLGQSGMSRVGFFRICSYILCLVGTFLLLGSCWFFLSRRWSEDNSTSGNPESLSREPLASAVARQD
jgi:hypothetical protein